MMTDTLTRRLKGCAYEAPHPHAVPWSHAGMRKHLPVVCPGYTTSLPEVGEASWARFYLEKGNLDQWTDEPLTERTRDAIQVLAIACDEAQAHELEEQRSKAGGR